MRRQFFIILTLLAFLFCKSAYADQHYEVQGVFEGETCGKIISFDLYEQGEDIIAVSSLFPEYAVVSKTGNDILSLAEYQWIFDIKPDSVSDAIESIHRLTEDWLSQQKSDTAEGLHAGNLFDADTTVKSCEFKLSGFFRFMKDHINQTGNDPASSDNTLLNGVISCLSGYISEFDPEIYVRRYQDDMFWTFLIINQENIMMTVSFDFSPDNGEKVLTSWRTDGRYCFRDTEIRHEDSELTISSLLYIGGASAYSAYKEKEPLIREKVSLGAVNEENCRFSITLESGKFMDPMIANGTIIGQHNGYNEISMRVNIGENESDTLNISLIPETTSRAVNFSDKKICHTDNENESREIQMAAISGVMSLAADILPVLPADYQQMLINLLID